jgi:hypothetical protein
MRHLTVLIAVAPILFFSIHDMTHILTYDETYIAFEPVDILKSQMYQWKLGNFRTTDIVIGLPIAVVSFVTGFSKDILIVFAKLMHWITSIFLVWRCVKSLIRISSIKRSWKCPFPLLCSRIVSSLRACFESI